MSLPSTLPPPPADVNVQSTKTALDAKRIDKTIDTDASSDAKRNSQSDLFSQEDVEILQRLEQGGYNSSAALSALLQAQAEGAPHPERRALGLLLQYQSLGPRMRDRVRSSSKISEPKEQKRRGSAQLDRKVARRSPPFANAVPKSLSQKQGQLAGAAQVLKSPAAGKSQGQATEKQGVLQNRTFAVAPESVSSISSPRGPETTADHDKSEVRHGQAENLPDDYDDEKWVPGLRHSCHTPSKRFPFGYYKDPLGRRYPLNEFGLRRRRKRQQADIPGRGNSKRSLKSAACCTDGNEVDQKKSKHSSSNEETRDAESDVDFKSTFAELQAWLDRRRYMPWLKSANPDERALAAWVELQRKQHCMLSASHVSMLEALQGWTWAQQTASRKRIPECDASVSSKHLGQTKRRTRKTQEGSQHRKSEAVKEANEIGSHAAEFVKDKVNVENSQQKLHNTLRRHNIELAQQKSRSTRRALLRRWQLMYHPDKNHANSEMASAIFRWVQSRWHREFRSNVCPNPNISSPT
eukprot:gnl/MRDRNA2_/MRDRNA2_57456_c0_seq2.p1 gnl/MRDRNA2_/MRDRNA2_57456_c0~~gnl/MRDRNA2_/MRDRNA2_57456_c0_seq2.p1  ORF type:complete len:523 (-),score=117.87 gnl/MRDRNA2_/MRDRNA2_57456_c0_seq2:121-1689(-)